MTKAATETVESVPDETLKPYLAQIDEYMAKPLKTPAEIEAEEQAKSQRREQLMMSFDNSETGRKLHQLRFDKYVLPTLQRLMTEMQTMTPWACRMAGILTEADNTTNPDYRAWDVYYDQHLTQFIKQHGG